MVQCQYIYVEYIWTQLRNCFQSEQLDGVYFSSLQSLIQYFVKSFDFIIPFRLVDGRK